MAALTPDVDHPRPRPRLLVLIGDLNRLARRLALVVAAGLSTLLLSVFVAGVTPSTALRLGGAVALALGVPALLRWRVGAAVKRWTGRRLPLGYGWSMVAWNGALLAVLCLALPQVTGQALRRRGDWWVGQSDGWVAEQVRAGLGRAGRWIEQRGAPPPEPMFAALPPQPPPTPPDPTVVDPAPPDPQPRSGAWLHPFNRRVLPPNAVCRFGAHRPGRRPAECELGHCGVDLPAVVGTPVYAVQAGVVLKAERDEGRGGRAGRYVKLAHRDDAVRSWYVHLDEVDPRIRPGAEVAAGQRLGTIGLTGVKSSGPHLHFALAIKRGKRHHYVDPEPLLWIWPPTQPAKRPAVAALAP